MENSMSTPRNYDRELDDSNCATNEKYAYSFDFDVMHPFMIRAFKPFFRTGSLLELGSYKGDFTRRFLYQFDDLTCVEASELAIKEGKLSGDDISFKVTLEFNGNSIGLLFTGKISGSEIAVGFDKADIINKTNVPYNQFLLLCRI